MLTLIGYLVLGLFLVAGLYLAGVFLLPKGEQMSPAVRDDPGMKLAQGLPIGGDDVDDVRLPVALRGYRFAETDELLDRLAHEIRWRDAELARLGFRFPAGYQPHRAEEPQEQALTPEQAVPGAEYPAGFGTEQAVPGAERPAGVATTGHEPRPHTEDPAQPAGGAGDRAGG